MTATTQNISSLVALRGDDGRSLVRFGSDNPGLYHQLYVNGVLAGWTDHPQQRQFALGQLDRAAELTVVAVDASERTIDQWNQLGLAQSHPWICTLRVIRPAGPAGLRLIVRGDRATGVIDDKPLAVAELTSRWSSGYGFALDGFGAGAMGLDGSNGPGLSGAFGAGPFGCGAEVLELRLPLAAPGEHQLHLLTAGPKGQLSDPTPVSFRSSPPPPPARCVSVIDYDHPTGLLTLQAN